MELRDLRVSVVSILQVNFIRISFARLKQNYKPEIRKWLDDNPLTEDKELDVHGVPVSLFDLTDAPDRLKQLNRQIKELPLKQQKLLLYLRLGDKQSCMEQLRAIKADDPAFYKRVAAKLYRTINR